MALPINIWFLVVRFVGEPGLFALNRQMKREIYDSEMFWKIHFQSIAKIHGYERETGFFERDLKILPDFSYKTKSKICFSKVYMFAKSQKLIVDDQINILDYLNIKSKMGVFYEYTREDAVAALEEFAAYKDTSMLPPMISYEAFHSGESFLITDRQTSCAIL